MDETALDAKLLAAHASGNNGALVPLYTHAADSKEATGDIDASCFFLTQALVFALECGDPAAHQLNKRLVAHGRADPIAGTPND